MSQRDRDRLVILRQVDQGILTVSEGARRARLSLRQFRRLVRRFEAEGDRAVVHRGRGRRPNNAQSPELRRRALEQAGEPLYSDFGPTLLSEHLARDPAFGVGHPATLRVWLIAEGL
ncbi:MAG: helix-turn-helix domain-containing protein, partial [Gemmatimonadetes bacterium]|nr:helix-turn-helix domain-containing protein [Gemmatimonadota bacterium]